MHIKYMHLEKFGNEEVEDIQLGHCYIFPKLDGTNASVWEHEGDICAGSRTRQLSSDADNQGFYNWLMSDDLQADAVRSFFFVYPDLRLFGEWLVPHTFQGYRPEAWRKFYVFDVMNANGEYLPYTVYKDMLDAHGIEYIAPLCEVKNPSIEFLKKAVDKNHYLCINEDTVGEGIVLKNYDYYNKFGRQCWAKVVHQEFKEAHAKAMGAPVITEALGSEDRIVADVVTQHFVDKAYEKIKAEKGGWRSEYIPQLLNVVFYDVVKEELWDVLKKHSFPKVDFKVLRSLVYQQVKLLKKDIF